MNIAQLLEKLCIVTAQVSLHSMEQGECMDFGRTNFGRAYARTMQYLKDRSIVFLRSRSFVYKYLTLCHLPMKYHHRH
jgi:hypothetical protein